MRSFLVVLTAVFNPSPIMLLYKQSKYLTGGSNYSTWHFKLLFSLPPQNATVQERRNAATGNNFWLSAQTHLLLFPDGHFRSCRGCCPSDDQPCGTSPQFRSPVDLVQQQSLTHGFRHLQRLQEMSCSLLVSLI